ncbi:hypothetical protein [Ralstonia phage phiRSL1]|uniref:Uncharacterized protein n=1 Tax=Ralstonia phage phiRSL1 TaxID=1980924 RepID=B2ZY74_9CAUD|nr:hypothetical protein RSL1_ORF262 [Ralstonia phage phiRSL1]BAG41709.1 hypothetical protein [Ralstonia phage phiRSL1]
MDLVSMLGSNVYQVRLALRLGVELNLVERLPHERGAVDKSVYYRRTARPLPTLSTNSDSVVAEGWIDSTFHPLLEAWGLPINPPTLELPVFRHIAFHRSSLAV